MRLKLTTFFENFYRRAKVSTTLELPFVPFNGLNIDGFIIKNLSYDTEKQLFKSCQSYDSIDPEEATEFLSRPYNKHWKLEE